MAHTRPQHRLTPDVQRRLTDALRVGSFISAAAWYAGISRSTFYRWIKRGKREKEGPYHEFFLAVREALAAAEMFALGCVRREMRNNWRAAMAFLERRYRPRWGRGAEGKDAAASARARPRHATAVPHPIATLTDDDYAEIMQILVRADPALAPMARALDAADE